MNFPDELTPAIYTFAEKHYKMFITDHIFTDDSEYCDLKQFMLYLFNQRDENFMPAMIHLVTCILTKETDPETNERTELNELLDSIITRISDITVTKFNESYKIDTLVQLTILKKNYQISIDSNIGEQIINCHSFARITIETNREKLEKKLNKMLTKNMRQFGCENFDDDVVEHAAELDEPVELEDTNSDSF